MSIVFRDYKPENPGERAYCNRGWVKSYADSAVALLTTYYWQKWDGLVIQLLDACQVRVAVDEETGGLAGFICFERDTHGPIVHYVYVTHSFRRRGIGSRLVKQEAMGEIGQLRVTARSARFEPGEDMAGARLFVHSTFTMEPLRRYLARSPFSRPMRVPA